MNRQADLGALLIALACAAGIASDARAGSTGQPDGAAAGAPTLALQRAEPLPVASHATVLAAARAGKRIVAVGELGTVLLSDDDGASFRPSRAVPVAATLTSVSFASSSVGWAVGHWGAILRTDDGGETWRLQRHDLRVDQPLLAVHFFDDQRGVAVGLWSLVLTTRDGGSTWSKVALAAAPGLKKVDLNLYDLFAGTRDEVFAVAEQGRLLRSSDAGATWQYLDTGYRGSLWTGLRLADGALLVAGLRGTVMRSEDAGASWHRVPADSKSSVTGLLQTPDGRVFASALDGVLMVSKDGATGFTSRQSPDRVAFTGLIANRKGDPILLSRDGPRAQLP